MGYRQVILFLDIDGTIRDFDGTVPESAVSAIRQARKNGHEVCLCSGRPLHQIEQGILDIGFDGIVATSGGYVSYHNRLLSHRTLPTSDLLDLTEYLMRRGCVFEIQTFHESYVLRDEFNSYRFFGAYAQKKMNAKTDDEKHTPAIVETAQDIPDAEKVNYFGDAVSPEDITRAFAGTFRVVPLCIPAIELYGGEISPAGVSKALGIQDILNESGCRREDTAAVGDSENDLEMLDFAGTAIVMGNGNDAAKAHADYVTASLRDDGLAKAFRHYHLI